MISALPPFLTSEDAAQLLHCKTETIEERLRVGDLPGEKFGTGWIIPSAALVERVNEIANDLMVKRRMVAAGSKVQMPRGNNAASRQPPKL